MVLFSVVNVNVPPSGIASREFIARFSSTCSICPGSARTDHRSFAGRILMSIVDSNSRLSIGRSSVRRSFMLMVAGAREPSHCFHLLRLPELQFELLAAGEIVDEAFEVRVRAVPDCAPVDI